MFRAPILLVLCLCLASGSALAQGRNASLSGRIVDASGAIIPAAVIVLRHEALGVERRLTAAAGEYRADDLTPGDYLVTAASTGFTSETRRITLSAGTRGTLQFQLHVGDLSEAVVVTAEVATSPEILRRLPGSVDVVERETLERSRVFTTNEALRKVAGVHVRDEEGLGLRPNISIRGVNPTRSTKVLLLEDGIPLTYAPYGDNASYYHPPVERFDRIEVMKGGAQIAYGPQTLAGLVNYVTPAPPTKSSASITLTGGNRGYFNGHGGYGATFGGTGFLIDYMHKQSDGARDNISSDLNDLSAKVVQRAGARQTWTFRGNYFGEDSNITYSGLRLDEYVAAPRGNAFLNDFFYTDRFGTSATHAVTLTGALALTTNVYYTNFKRHWWRQSSNSNERPNDASDPACGGMANLSTTCGNQGRLRQYHTVGLEPRMRLHYRAFGVTSEADFGARVHAESQDRRQENGDTPAARTGVLVESNLRSSAAYSGFVQNRFLLDDWTITPGVRVEHVEYERTNELANGGAGVTGNTDLTQVVPGIGASYSRGDNFTWFGGVHRGFAPPRTEDIISNTGGVVDLDAELSWNYEVGVRSTLKPGARVDATFFVLDYENQVVPASLAGGVGALLTNGGETLHRGIELTAKVDSVAITGSQHNLFFRTAYTYLPVARFTGIRYSSVPGFGSTSVSGNRLPYAPEHLATIGFGYSSLGRFDMMVEAVHTSQQYGDDVNTVASTADGQRGLIPGYTVWNTAVNYDLRKMTLFLTVKNLLNDLFIVDRSRGILPGAPRLVQAGINFRF